MLYDHIVRTSHRPADRLVEIALVVLLAALLVVAIPLTARVPVAADPEPRPLAAPRPVAVVDLPEQARVDGACLAVLTRSSAVGNERSQRAADITAVLLEDACLDG